MQSHQKKKAKKDQMFSQVPLEIVNSVTNADQTVNRERTSLHGSGTGLVRCKGSSLQNYFPGCLH